VPLAAKIFLLTFGQSAVGQLADYCGQRAFVSRIVSTLVFGEK
jgi:hypothetical protein